MKTCQTDRVKTQDIKIQLPSPFFLESKVKKGKSKEKIKRRGKVRRKGKCICIGKSKENGENQFLKLLFDN